MILENTNFECSMGLEGGARSAQLGRTWPVIRPEGKEECVTAYDGVPLFLQAVRSLDVPGRVKQHLQIKQRQRGLDEAGYGESFLVFHALGGDCLEDFDRLREDEGLPEMLGHEMPGPEAARKFLYQFHDETKLETAQRELPVGRS